MYRHAVPYNRVNESLSYDWQRLAETPERSVRYDMLGMHQSDKHPTAFRGQVVYVSLEVQVTVNNHTQVVHNSRVGNDGAHDIDSDRWQSSEHSRGPQ